MLVCFVILMPLSVLAQVKIEGVVVDMEQKPLNGAVVSVLESASRSKGYDITNQRGEFSVEVSSDSLRLQLYVAMMGYENKILNIDNKSQSKTLQLNTQAFKLKEVVFHSDRVWKREDTIVYSVESFRSKQDRSIGDLLKKLPGVEVSESGGIKYNGEAINKFYIEGMDLLENKYGLATNNVPVDAVQNVEVIENHQPVKTLKETVFSDKAAINLKLKGDKIARPVGTVGAGVGLDENGLLWLLNAFAMQVHKNKQTIVMYKTNNMGVDISKEMTEHILGFSGFGSTSVSDKHVFSENAIGSMHLEDKRYLFNKTHLATVNHLKKISDDKQLRVNANYMYNYRDEKISQTSSYFLPGNNLYIEEVSQPEQTSNLVDAALSYTNNSGGAYLYNKADAKLKWDKINTEIVSEQRITENYDLPTYKLTNDFQLVKKIGNNTWDILSKINYSSKPQSMVVEESDVTDKLYQNAHYTGLYADVSTSYTYVSRQSSFSLDMALSGWLESLNSNLQSDLFTDSTQNKLSTDLYTLKLTPKYQLNLRRTKLTLSANVQQYILKADNQSYTYKQTQTPFYILPRFNLTHKLNPYWDGVLSYAYNKSIGDIMDYALGVIQTGYRNASMKSGLLSKRSSQSASLRLNYKNVLKTLFFNTSLSYIHSERNLLPQQRFVGIQSISSTIQQNNSSQQWMWYAYVGKYVNSINSNFSIRTNLNYATSEKMQQNRLYPLHSYNWSIQGDVLTKFTEDFNVTYKLQFNPNWMKIKYSSIGGDADSTSKTWTISQIMKLYYHLAQKWEFSLQGEHLQNKLSSGDTKNILFGDVQIKYATGKVDLWLAWNNIFNQKAYRIVSYHELDTYTYSYRLRPSNVMLQLTFKY